MMSLLWKSLISFNYSQDILVLPSVRGTLTPPNRPSCGSSARSSLEIRCSLESLTRTWLICYYTKLIEASEQMPAVQYSGVETIHKVRGKKKAWLHLLLSCVPCVPLSFSELWSFHH